MEVSGRLRDSRGVLETRGPVSGKSDFLLCLVTALAVMGRVVRCSRILVVRGDNSGQWAW